jgi:hypothetical protein
MHTRYILPAVLAALFAVAYVSDPVDTPEPEVKQAIKLTTRHLPIHKYFADDDEDDSLTVAQQYFIARRETSVKTQTDVAPTEDDVVISDGVRLRLMLARMKALNKYNEIHGVDKL